MNSKAKNDSIFITWSTITENRLSVGGNVAEVHLLQRIFHCSVRDELFKKQCRKIISGKYIDLKIFKENVSH